MAQNSRLPEKALVALGIVVSFGWKVELSLAFNSAVRTVFCPCCQCEVGTYVAIVLLTVGQNDCDVLFLAQYLGWQQTFEIQMKRFLVRPRPIHTNTTRACLVGRNVQQILFGGGIRSDISPLYRYG